MANRASPIMMRIAAQSHVYIREESIFFILLDSIDTYYGSFKQIGFPLREN